MDRPEREDIFTDFPASDFGNQVVRPSDPSLDEVAFFFAEAAQRLAASHTGTPVDDTLLFPFMNLNRHAYELAIKAGILRATQLRRRLGEEDPSLNPDKVRSRLKRKLRHRLIPLLEELDAHLGALGLDPIPAEARALVSKVALIDPTGESFRYGEGLPDGTDVIDFPRLAEAMEDTFNTLTGVEGMLDDVEHHLVATYGEWSAELRSIERDVLRDVLVDPDSTD